MNSDYDPKTTDTRARLKFDKALARETLFKQRRLPRAHVLEEILKNLRPGERLVLYALSALLGFSVLILLVGINREATVVVPSRGGNITEGAVGSVRFINPLLAVSQTDKDLVELVFSGLTKTLADGSVLPNLAVSYEISEDGKTYTFFLRDGATFHDGEPLTAKDVLFTIQMAQHQDVKSPRRPDWEGVVVTSPDERTVVFTLPNAYAPFLENTTLGILPEHSWKDVPPEEYPFSTLNTNPIGSGAFQFKSANTDHTGAITELRLKSFANYILGSPHLRSLKFRFYPNEETLLAAHNSGAIEAFAGILPTKTGAGKDNSTELRATLPRVFGVFFNQNHLPLLADPAVRAALEASVDKNALINEVLQGFGTTLSGPIPPGTLAEELPPKTEEESGNITKPEEDMWKETAHGILKKGGWSFDGESGVWRKKKVPLAFTLVTADAPELVKTAEYIAERWKQIGADVSVHVYTLSELNNTVIRPRSYDALLFGEVVGKTLDLFAFWHSSQRNDPGLNLALYANTRADSLLQEARGTVDKEEREELYRAFAKIGEKDTPAIFLYAPQFTYVVPRHVRGVKLGAVTTPEDRFAEVHTWYIDTERVWNVFAPSE